MINDDADDDGDDVDNDDIAQVTLYLNCTEVLIMHSH